jgi:competence protein ComEA
MKTLKLALALLIASAALPASAASKSSKLKVVVPKPSGVVNVNTATAEQLAFLPRTGAKAAQRIADYRKAHGSFQRLEDLMEVKGVGEKQFIVLRPYITVSGDTTLGGKIKSTGSRARHTTRQAPKA